MERGKEFIVLQVLLATLRIEENLLISVSAFVGKYCYVLWTLH